jgi:isopentenyl phosphate kinase
MPDLENEVSTALRKTLSAVEELGEASAHNIARQTGREYGRESQYLNELARMGFLTKRRVGHQTLFSIAQTQLTILKLGGSLLTHKDKPFTTNASAIERLAEEIGVALKSDEGPKRMIIAIGGGSFGHPIAREHMFSQISGPFKTAAAKQGFAELHYRMGQLVSEVVRELLRNNVQALPVDVQTGIYPLDGGVRTDWLQLLLKLGFVPILNGCALIDNQEEVRIVSADQLVYVIAAKLNPSKVIFGIDIDGLYTGDPKTSKSAKLIEELNLEELDKISFGVMKYADVTGGMLEKIKWGLAIARIGIDVKLVNGLKPHLIEKTLCGEKVKGTAINAYA